MLSVLHSGAFTIISLLIITVFINSNDAWLFSRSSKSLPIDGGWSEWSNWTTCHPNIENNVDFYPPWKGFLLASRSRTCDLPKPARGGKDCEGNQYRYKQCGCRYPLGLQSGRVSNTQLSASSELGNFTASNGRLGSKFAWCAKEERISRFANTFFQVDFNKFVFVKEIATEGIREGRVTRYRIKYSVGGNESWTLYRGTNTNSKQVIVRGNTRPNRVKTVRLRQPFVAKSIRLYPVTKFGSICMKTEIYGCEFTCGKLLTAPSGNIARYSSSTINQDCLWRVKVANTTVINLYFDIFHLPCQNGSVEVRDASSQFSDSVVKQRFCGENEVGPYKFQGNDMWIRFRSNSHEEEVGFNMRYMSVCEKHIKLIANEEYILTSPNFPDDYPHNTDCKWKITTARQHLIRIEFIEFEIEQSSGVDNCGDDYLQIEGTGKGSQKFCNARRPNKVLFRNASEINIKFISDDLIAKKGFKIILLSLDPNTVVPTTPTSTVALTTTLNTLPKVVKVDPTDTPAIANTDNINFPEGTAGSNSKIHQNVRHQNSSDVYPSKSSKTTDDDEDDTWTVIIIGAFSGIVLVLLIIVGGINIHRCVHNRNMYVQAKLGQKACSDELAAKEKQRKLKADIEAKMLLLRGTTPGGDVTPGGDIHDSGETADAVCAPAEEIALEDTANEEQPDQHKEKDNGEAADEAKSDDAKVTSPAHSQMSSGESSSVYVDCHEDLEEIPESDKYSVVDIEPSIYVTEDCAESIV